MSKLRLAMGKKNRVFPLISIRISWAPLLLIAMLSGSVWGAALGVLDPSQPHEEWLKHVQDSINRMEYEVTWQEKNLPSSLPACYHMANKEQDIRAYFTPEGVHLFRRTGESSTDGVTMTLARIGRGGHFISPGDSLISTDSNWLEYESGLCSISLFP